MSGGSKLDVIMPCGTKLGVIMPGGTKLGVIMPCMTMLGDGSNESIYTACLRMLYPVFYAELVAICDSDSTPGLGMRKCMHAGNFCMSSDV